MNKKYQNLIEITKSEETAYKGKFLEFNCDEVYLPNGETSMREYVNHPGAVAILVIDEENNVLFEEQFRYPLHEVILEIPAGKLEKNEDILFAANRELEEETGLVANKLIKLGISYPCVGYSNEVIHLFLAVDCKKGKQHLDDEEFLNVVKIPFDEVKKLIKNGVIKDSKTIQAIYLYELICQK